MKVIREQLIEAAIQIFIQNITYQPSMRRRVFLVCLFYCFFILPIYESIADFFWQSASYVFNSREAIAAIIEDIVVF